MTNAPQTVLLATDDTLELDLEALCGGLNRICAHLRFSAHPDPIVLGRSQVSSPSTYQKITEVTRPLLLHHSAVLIVTELPYDNNYFWDSDDRVVIASVSGWERLTNLPKSNGLVGFLASILAQELDPSSKHDENTGCIYDFLWDKRGIDARLRSGVICRACLARVQQRAGRFSADRLELFDCTIGEGLEDLKRVLDELSQASKWEADILVRWRPKVGRTRDFDVFLCHNSKDKPSVRKLYTGLLARNLSPWFDEEHLRPGIPWQRELEVTIPSIRSVAVVVGPYGEGPWQEVELDAFIREFVRRRCPVIPVLLDEASSVPNLPIFLQAFTWVDFRKPTPDPWKLLAWGITGIRPE